MRARRLLLDGGRRRGFSAHRPPGHHAEPARAMGFCLFNNIAVAARHALDERGLERVLILDWDVHHGNGTNDIFHASREVLFVSIHQSPLYPGTGPPCESGVGARGRATPSTCRCRPARATTSSPRWSSTSRCRSRGRSRRSWCWCRPAMTLTPRIRSPTAA